MTRNDLLTQLRALEGVTSAALVARSGELFTLPGEVGPFAAVAEALATYLTSDRVLAELLGAELPTQTVLEFGSGTALLTQATELGGEPYSVVALFAARDLNRVRFGLRRLLPASAGVVKRSPQPRP